MEMLKLGGFAVCAAVMALTLRRMRPEMGLALSLGAGAMLLLFVAPTLQEAVESIAAIARTGGLSDAYMGQLLKVCGVSLTMDFAAQTCRDAGEDGLAMKVETAGRVALIALSLPFMSTLLTQIMSLPV